MVWAAINYRFMTQLVVCQGNLKARRYIDQVLRPVVVPMFRQRQNLVYQHNNARPHVARATRDFLQANNIGVLPWPACSPDCNPIEHAWDYLGRRLRRRQPQPANVQQLTAALHQEWGRIPRYLLRKFVWFHETSLLTQVEVDTHATDFRNENSPTGLFKITFF